MGRRPSCSSTCSMFSGIIDGCRMCFHSDEYALPPRSLCAQCGCQRLCGNYCSPPDGTGGRGPWMQGRWQPGLDEDLYVKGELLWLGCMGIVGETNVPQLWNWMELNLPTGKWLFCGNYNHTKFVEDLMGPTPLLHGSKRRS